VEGLGDPVAHSGHGRPVPPGQGRRATAAAARSAVLGARPHPLAPPGDVDDEYDDDGEVDDDPTERT